jgi:protein-disulfide isomerase
MPLWGDSSALVTVMLFGDLDCPYTRRALTALDHLEERFGADLRVAFRHRPVPSHRTARQAGITAAALHAERGDPAFWSLALDLAQRPPPASPARFEAWARRAGEDPSRVAVWGASESASALVDRDFALAVRYGIRKTPTFFVNGERREGFKDEQALSVAIEHGLAQALEAVGDGIARRALYAQLTARNFIGIDAAGRERTCPSPAEAPTRGAADAPVTLVFFGDFACQYCRQMVPIVADLAKRFPSDLRVVYKNLPHTDHPLSMRLARFAQEAFARGGSEAFWRVYDALFAIRGEPDDARLRSIAEAAGLVPAQLLAASRTEGLGSALEAIAKEAEALEVDGTPTIFVNGKRFDGVVARATLARRVTQESEFGRRLAERGVARARLYDVICPPPKPAEPPDADDADEEE